MATSVKLSEEAKSRLEELQAEIRLKTGRKVTQQELLDRLVQREYESREDLIETFRETTVPLSEERIDTFFEGTFASGTETRESDVDRVLYGSE